MLIRLEREVERVGVVISFSPVALAHLEANNFWIDAHLLASQGKGTMFILVLASLKHKIL